MKLFQFLRQWRVSHTFNNERRFLGMVLIFIFAAIAFIDQPHIAMWIGFGLAGYSAIANDSIQTIGTFLASNSKRPWWLLWIFIGGIFLATVGYSFFEYSGDVSYGRLASKGFEQSPTSFHLLQIIAPLFLLIMTRMRIPVSTTFLLLTSFAASSGAISKVFIKSISGYVIAFMLGFLVFMIVSRLVTRFRKFKVHPRWVIAQWITSGTLWATWIMQDAANVAVFLPRSLELWQFGAFAGYIFLVIGYIMWKRGDRIQEIVNEKSHIKDIRMATIVDLIYAVILYFFKVISSIPMSTTWVFLGLLAGRELALNLTKTGRKRQSDVWRIIWRDVGYAAIGLIVSVAIAIAANEKLQVEIFEILERVLALF